MRIIGQMIRVHPLSLLAEVRRKVSLCVTVTPQPIFLSLIKTTNQLTTTKKLSTNPASKRPYVVYVWNFNFSPLLCHDYDIAR
jgi:hypothetical protein